MEITVNLQLADRVEQYEVDLIDIIAAYKTAKKEYFKNIDIDINALNATTFLILRSLIDEQVSITEEQEVVSWVDDENLATLKAYVAKVTHVMEL